MANVTNIPNEENVLATIAKQELGFPTLQTRNSDSLDFREVSVWQLKEALHKAYLAGKLAGRENK